MPTQKDRILALLEERGPLGVLNIELNEITYRYSARIADLRKEGYRIRLTHIKGSVYCFTLLEADAPEYIDEPEYAEFREVLRPSPCCGEIVIDGFCGGCHEHV